MKLLKGAQQSLIEGISNRQFVRLANSTSSLKGHRHRIAMNDNDSMITLSDGKNELNICRRDRLWLYKRGIDARLKQLNESYLLHRITGPLDGAFIDCGANVGELGAYSRSRGLEYHAFEPEPLEADCCDLNNFGGRRETNRFGLWSSDGELTFYSKPNTADGSLFETDEYVDQFKIKVRSLDSFAAEAGIRKVAVLKIEAEGAEPEILAGAYETLKSTAYVTVDCGFEKGVNKESTLVPVFNILLDSGFEAIEWNPQRVTALFKAKAR
ncbi:FkbM family methyltransferase [Ensifer sp.]|jgi:FkbM family methyltransferase|uniref:FkbM family methyltransferase n=1 Tax=Ensifer sp. TaxID=1872086 RepID=UPI002E0D5175|nr:FkbM family methyltransferase [Ensifer sp.]